MNKNFILILTIVAIQMSCGTNVNKTSKEEVLKASPDTQAVTVQDISAEKAQELISSGSVHLLDVRTPEEVSAGFIKNCNLFLDFNSSDFEKQIETLDKSKSVLVYCKGGGRSARACDMLVQRGFTKVYNLLGGFDNWSGEIVTK